MKTLMEQALRAGVFPSACAAVIRRDGSTTQAAVGPVGTGTLFDLASLTKVLATAPALARLCALGLCELDDAASHFWPAFGEGGKAAITLRQLLAHTSGLAALRPLFLSVLAAPATAPLFRPQRPSGGALVDLFERARCLMLWQLEREPTEAPPGSRALYCDLGFLALGHLVERIAREPFDTFVQREVFEPLGLVSFGFNPRSSDVAPTGIIRPREPAPGQEGIVPPVGPDHDTTLRVGEVDDDNAYAMGGVAGHAGLFGSARDVAGFGQAVLDELDGAGRIAEPALWEEFVTRQGPDGTTRALGFDTPSAQGSSAGTAIARSRAFGHLGFTGTSLWVDRDRGLSIALLSNRTHPHRGNDAIRAFRPAFHDRVVATLEKE